MPDKLSPRERIGVVVMWIGIALFPVPVAKCPTLDHTLLWLFSPFRDHLSAIHSPSP